MEETPNARIRQLLDSKGMKVPDAAERSGVKQSTLYGVIQGKTAPSFETLQSILTAFPDISSDWLLLGTGPMLRDGRALSPAPVERPATTAAPVPQVPMMQVVDESGELRAVKDERDFLREQVKLLQRMLAQRPGTATGTDGSGFNSGAERTAEVYEHQRMEVAGLVRYQMCLVPAQVDSVSVTPSYAVNY